MSTATVEQLAKVKGIFHQLDHAIPPDMAENRRQAPRINVRLAFEVVSLATSSPVPIQIFSRNLSISGLGFVSRRLFKVEERIVIRLNAKDLPAKMCLARVTFGRYITGGMYEMGAEFLECVKDNGNTPIPSHWMLSAAEIRLGKVQASAKPEEKQPEAKPSHAKPEKTTAKAHDDKKPAPNQPAATAPDEKTSPEKK